MLVTVDMRWLLGALLISARLGALLLMSPLTTMMRVPAQVWVLLILVFGVSLNICLQQYEGLAIVRADQILVAVAREIAVGALMAFGLHCAFASFSLGGRILDLQMGFGVASLLNPSTNEQSPLMGVALLLVGVLTFYLLGGHHWLARAVVQSYQWFPLAKPLPTFSLAAIVAQFGMMFTLGFLLVAPVVITLLLLDGAMAIASRTMPQMNIFMLSIPIKIGVGLLILALSVPFMRSSFQRIFESIFAYWSALV